MQRACWRTSVQAGIYHTAGERQPHQDPIAAALELRPRAATRRRRDRTARKRAAIFARQGTRAWATPLSGLSDRAP